MATLAREPRLDTAPAPDREAGPRTRDWAESEGVRKAAAAARGPLRPASQTPPARAKRAFYTEMSEKQRSDARLIAQMLPHLPLSSRERIKPTMVTDAELEQELTERRAEIEALARDLEARRVKGPHVQQARLDNAELVRRAALIEPALDVEGDAATLTTEQRQLAAQRYQLNQQLAEIGGHKFLARNKVQKRIDEIGARLEQLGPAAAEARADAEVAAQRTQTPRHTWDETIREADPRRQDERVRVAEEADRRAIEEDRGYLAHLQREAGRFVEEHKRRAGLTPTQRAAEEQTRARGQEPGKKPVKKFSKPPQKPGTPAPDYTQGITPPSWDGPERGSGLGR